jgi:hypothetical protein
MDAMYVCACSDRLPDAGIALLRRVKAAGYGSTAVFTAVVDIAGTSYYTSAKCAFVNEFINSFGRQPQRFDEGADCTTFFVQAMPAETVHGISTLALQVDCGSSTQ